MVRPTLRSLAAAGSGLVLAVAAAAVSPSLWWLWASFWIAFGICLVVDLALSTPSRGWTAAARLPDTIAVGEERTVPVRVEPPGAGPVEVELRFDVSDDLEPFPPLRLRVPGGGIEVPVPLRARRRGRVALEAVWIRYRGPLGLLERVRRLPVESSSAAVPDLGPVREAAIRFFSTREQRAGLKIERYVGEGSEFESLREFLPGHDHRAIDWKASARHTKLLVREFRAERNHQVVLAVDTGRLMAEPLEGLARLDHAIHAALVLAYVGLRSGDRVGLYAFDAEPRLFVEPRSGRGAFPALLAGTRDLDYGARETNFTLGLTDLAGRLHRRSLIVVLTDFVDSVSAELMVENLNRLARRHVTLFVTLRDPLLAELAGAPPRTLEEMNRAVVARGFRRDRDAVLRRLRRLGILYVDAPPRRVGVGLVNRYLHVKRRELIA